MWHINDDFTIGTLVRIAEVGDVNTTVNKLGARTSDVALTHSLPTGRDCTCDSCKCVVQA